MAKCESITTISLDRILSASIGRLDDLTLRSVINAIGDAIAAECEPVG
ncbi:MAG: hypothetical protein AAGD32_08065 [Planctomycetota bacterium]